MPLEPPEENFSYSFDDSSVHDGAARRKRRNIRHGKRESGPAPSKKEEETDLSYNKRDTALILQDLLQHLSFVSTPPEIPPGDASHMSIIQLQAKVSMYM